MCYDGITKEVAILKMLLLKKKIGKNRTSLTVTLHPHQLQAIGCEHGSDVEVYVKGKKIIIEKVGN